MQLDVGKIILSHTRELLSRMLALGGTVQPVQQPSYENQVSNWTEFVVAVVSRKRMPVRLVTLRPEETYSLCCDGLHHRHSRVSEVNF